MATIVTYNGVVLYNVVTREWSQEVAYDESHTDAMFHTFRLRFEGILHADYSGPGWVSGPGPSESAVANYAVVHARILKAREVLTVSVSDSGGEQTWLFRCDPAPGDPDNAATPAELANVDRDVNNGPKPLRFQILQIVGAKLLRVAFEIECAKVICPTTTYTSDGYPAGALPVVLSNRWSVSEEMDENAFITRNITGKLRLSAAVGSTGVDAKYLVIPGLERGFRRAAVNFSTDKAGLDCEYHVTDRQVHTAAPWPATKMSVQHHHSTEEGVNMRNEVHVELEGPPHADKKLLLSRAIQIIDAILNFAAMYGEEGRKRYFPEVVEYTDFIGEHNRVNAHVRFLETPYKDTDENIAILFGNLRENMGKPLELPDVAEQSWPYDPQWSDPHTSIYGYTPPGKTDPGGERRPTVLMLLQCYLQQPCIDQHGIAKAEAQYPGETEESEAGNRYYPEVTESPGGTLPYSPGDEWSDSAKTSIYTFVRMSSRYLFNQLRVQLPLAAVPASDSDDTCRVFRVGAPQCRRQIDIDVERAGIWPEIVRPLDDYDDVDLHGTLLRHWIEAHPPSLTADGVTRLYRLTAHYVYALNRPPKQDEQFRVGVMPHTKYGRTDPEVQFDPDQAYANEDMEP